MGFPSSPTIGRPPRKVLHEHKSIRLVLIDNAEDLFSTTSRPTRNKLLRQLACFQQVAESREVAITFLAAIPSLKLDPFRTGFLSALQHSARAVHLLAPDPESPHHRLLFTLKNTLSPTPATAGSRQPSSSVRSPPPRPRPSRFRPSSRSRRRTCRAR